MAKKKVKLQRFQVKVLKVTLVFLSLVAVIIGVYYLTGDHSLSSDSTIISNAFVPYVPNFDNLTIDDLPNIYLSGLDTAAYPYKSNIIISNAHLIEYDPQTNNIVRVNNRNILPGPGTGVIIDNKLYSVAENFVRFEPCKEKGDNPNCGYNITRRTLYVTDLDTGAIVQRYSDDSMDVFRDYIDLPLDKQTKPNLINASLADQGHILWIGTWSGMYRLNTLTNRFTFYSRKDLGLEGECHPLSMHSEDGHIWANITGDTSKYSCPSILALVNGKWKVLSDSDLTFYKNLPSNPQHGQVQYFNKTTQKYVTFNWQKENYYAISQKINDTYYLFASDGIYTLKKNEFPKLYKKMSLPFLQPDINAAYIDPDEDIAILSSNIGGMSSANEVLGDRFYVNVINLETGEVTDLLKRNNLFNIAYTNEMYSNWSFRFQFKKDGNTLRLLRMSSKNIYSPAEVVSNNDLLTIDLKTYRITPHW